MKINKLAVITIIPASGEKGGAERFYDGLVTSLQTTGTHVDRIDIPSDESTFDKIEELYLRCYDLDVSSYDGVISTKAPAYMVRHPRHICYLQHTMRVFYDMFEQEFPQSNDELKRQRELILKLDTGALQPPRTMKIFTIGNEVTRRLQEYNNLESEVLYQALSKHGLKNNGKYEYAFLPGRLHRWKRVDLVIRAMQYVKRPLTLKIAGFGEDGAAYRELAGDDDRIQFLGRVSEDELIELYANALVVPFIPIREDFGLITLEAFTAEKPMITCTDAGEPTYFVKNKETGFVCQPDPQAIAEKLEYFYDHPHEAKKMGQRGHRVIQHITWDNVAKKILHKLEKI